MNASTQVNGLTITMEFGESQYPHKIVIEGEDLKNRDMRGVTWGEVIERLRQQAMRSGADAHLRALVNRVLKEPFGHRSATAKRAIVAAVYTLAVQEGSGSPVRAVEERTGANLASVRTWVRQARKDGFLSHTERGEMGGEVTDAALGVLNDL